MGRSRSRKDAPRPFVAWDGEGATFGGRHVYSLLASSTGVSLERTRGLKKYDGLAALALGMSEYKGVHVGFAIGYDVNLLLRGMPRAQLARVWDGERVIVSDRGRAFAVEWRPRKWFKVRYWARGRSQKTPGVGGVWWDVWPFFQTSFVNALDKYEIGTQPERDRIRAMKLARSSFTAADAAAVRQYNALELRFLVELMDALRASMTGAELTPRRWDGPGAMAALVLEREGTAARADAPAPERALDAFQYAYYGGRVECVRYGTRKGRVYQYDLNSAYPWGMAQLPCRAVGCGAWEHVTGRCLAPFAVHRVRWNFPAGRTVYPLPWRSHEGSVYFPQAGEGWVWTPELRACAELTRYLEVLESWVWQSSCQHGRGPYAWIPELYQKRMAAKARGDAAEHAMKLCLNSLYGKTAQRVGAREDAYGRWRLPPFHDLAGAGFITSLVRARMYAAAASAPEHTIMLATDAIFSTRPLALHAPKAKELGAWALQEWAGCQVVQSGVYWLDELDPADGERVYSRGFDVESMRRDAVLEAWRLQRTHFPAELTRFVGLGMALAGDPKSVRGRAAFKRWSSWVTEKRELSLHPWGTKRTPLASTRDAWRALIATGPSSTRGKWLDPGGTGMMTTPSPVPWRPLVGRNYYDPDARALAESEEAGL